MATSLDFDSYENFQSVVATYLQRSNLNDHIPIFIQLAENRLGNIIMTLPQQVAFPFSIVPAKGTNLIQLPSDFGAMIRATYGNKQLTYISPENIKVENVHHRQLEFSIIGNTFYLQTHVDGSSKLVLHYYQALQGLSENNESNWLLEDYPNIYLYATLLEAEPYIMDDERIQLWESMLTEAIQEAKESARIAATPQKTKLTRTCS